MNAIEKRHYKRARAAGYDPTFAGRIAHTLARWNELDCGHECDRLVRMVAEPENESYFGVYGEPDGYTNQNGREISAAEERAEICRQIDLNGCWYVKAQCRTSPDDDWQDADGDCGMCIYDRPTDIFQNCYVEYMMRSALDAIDNAVGCGAGI